MTETLFDVMEQSGTISPSIRQALKRFQEKWQLTEYESIVETHTITESELADEISRKLNLERLYSIEKDDFDKEVVRRIPFKIARRVQSMIVNFDRDRMCYRLLVADPFQDFASTIKPYLDHPFSLVVGERKLVREAIDQFYPIDAQIPSAFKERGNA